MSTKIKTLLMNKVSSTHNKDFIIKNLKNISVTYKHNENNYIVNLSRVKDGAEQRQNDNLQNFEVQVDRQTFVKTVLTSLLQKDTEPIENSPQNIVIDFSSPNIAKPFHAGHLRSTIIGNFISNVNKYYNNKVTKINYLGDWGTQFGLLQYGLQAKNVNVDTLKTNAMKTLYQAYVYANQMATDDDDILDQARQYFTDIEQGRADLKEWKTIREITVRDIEQVYQRLGIQFNAYHWESDYNGEAIKDLMLSLQKKSIIKTDETGKKYVTVNDKNVTVLKSDNSTLYLSRDIAALIDRYKRFNFNKMLYVVDNSQTDHFKALFQVVKQVSEKYVEGCEHIKFGRLKGMSTRSGNVVFLDDILDEAKHKMYDQQRQSKNTRTSAVNEETCDILGTSAVVINDLKQRRQKEYTFSWDRALQSEGDSGIKLQYLHCRLWSLEKNCGIALPDICDPNYIPEEIVGEVVAELSRFEDVLQRSLDEYEACIIVNYLFRLARHVNRMINELKVKNVSEDLAGQRLLVFYSARQVVKTGLEILGVRPLYEM